MRWFAVRGRRLAMSIRLPTWFYIGLSLDLTINLDSHMPP
jgi:hypothetical protein